MTRRTRPRSLPKLSWLMVGPPTRTTVLIICLVFVLVVGLTSPPGSGQGPAVPVTASGDPVCGPGEVRENEPLSFWETWSVLSMRSLAQTLDRPEEPKAPRRIVIDLRARALTLYEGEKVLKRFPIAVGTPEDPSPVGEFKVVHKDRGWGGGFGTRWMGLNVPWGIYGIHGTNKPWSIGTAASHGCFRMFNRNVEELFPLVPTNTPVLITGREVFYRPDPAYRPGQAGQETVVLQLKLREAGFSPGEADGRYGPATTTAVERLEAFYGLPVDGVATKDVQYVVGLRKKEGDE